MFDVEDVAVLNTIKTNYSTNCIKCAGEMLSLWLARQPTASWNQLIMALKESHIKLNALASKLEGMLLKGKYIYVK